MPFNPDIHHRRTLRLRDHDYSGGGAYFVTICTHERERLFGDVIEGEMRCNGAGLVVQEEWRLTAALREYVVLDEFIVMPNHFHAVLAIDDRRVPARRAPGNDVDIGLGTARRAPTLESFAAPVVGSLATVIRSFKSAVTKRIIHLRDNPGAPVWQRNYYERVIRDERELNSIRQYIDDNPAKWEQDENHPDKQSSAS